MTGARSHSALVLTLLLGGGRHPPPRQRFSSTLCVARPLFFLRAGRRLDESRGVRDHPAIVLVIGVDHDDQVGAAFKGVPVASLLISAFGKT
jgi:hypothetical protein